MTLTIEKIPARATGYPKRPAREDTSQRLNIAVLFTSVEWTLAALKEAGDLANQLGAQIKLVVPQVVPYPLALEEPPVRTEFSELRFRVIAGESPVETTVQIYLCRDRVAAVKSALRPGSIVVIGGPRRWWPTKTENLARQLRDAGYEVVFKETE